MLNITINHAAFGDIVKVSRTSESGMVESRTIELSQLLDFIKEERHEKPRGQDRQRVGTFPEGTYSIIQWEGGYRIAVFLPEAKRPMQYGLKGQESAFTGLIWYPSLVFLIDVDVEKRRVNRMSAYAVKETAFSELSDGTRLYGYPFGNVSDSGSVCLGGNAIEGVSDYRETVEAALNVFFSAQTNDDYFNSKGWEMPQLALIEKCAKGKSFPAAIKNRLKPGRTLCDVLD